MTFKSFKGLIAFFIYLFSIEAVKADLFPYLAPPSKKTSIEYWMRLEAISSNGAIQLRSEDPFGIPLNYAFALETTSFYLNPTGLTTFSTHFQLPFYSSQSAVLGPTLGFSTTRNVSGNVSGVLPQFGLGGSLRLFSGMTLDSGFILKLSRTDLLALMGIHARFEPWSSLLFILKVDYMKVKKLGANPYFTTEGGLIPSVSIGLWL